MSFLRRSYRAVKVTVLFLAASVELLITRPRTRAERAAWLSRFCKRVLAAMGVTYSTLGPVPMRGAVVSNHLTYLDILLHSALRPCVFVSKIELRKTPLLGWMSMMSGTVYVARGAGGSAAKAAEGMAKGFRDGLPVVFFPEGTTGLGDEPAMSFRSGLIAQTIAAEESMVAAFVHYDLTPGDLARGKTTRNSIHWGPEGLLDNIWKFLDLRDVHATVRFADQPIAFSPEAIHNRKIAAVEARRAVVDLSTQFANPAP
ncbi:MAG: lysophospholipid acyltransferase family protein [Acidobacteriota bacterium]